MQFVIFADCPDPDNYIACQLAYKLFSHNVIVVLTGRPAVPKVDISKDTKNSDTITKWSKNILKAGFDRMTYMFKEINSSQSIPFIINGGCCPRTIIPHIKHFCENKHFTYKTLANENTFFDLFKLDKLLLDTQKWVAL